MSEAPNLFVIGLVSLVIAGLCLRKGLFLHAVRRQRMMRFVRASGVQPYEVEIWFRGSYDRLSDWLRRGVGLGVGIPALLGGLALLFAPVLPKDGIVHGPAWLAPLVVHGLLLLLVVALYCFSLLFALRMDRIVGAYVLAAMTGCNYDPLKARVAVYSTPHGSTMGQLIARATGAILFFAAIVLTVILFRSLWSALTA
jgi:hypothetical protein